MTLTETAKTIFASDRYATKLTGVELVVLEHHLAKCRLEVTTNHRNAMGGVMGGAIFTLADFAFAAAANSELVAQGKPLQWVSLESSIHFIANTSDSILTASARAIKQGTRTCLYNIEICDSKEKQIAVVTTSGICV